MRIQVVSDLHLEFKASGGTLDIPNVDNRTDLLILAGDITTARDVMLCADFFKQCADRFSEVVYIPGNHEFYHDDIERAADKLAMVGLWGVRYMNRDHIDLGDYYLFGATLWTDCNKGDPMTYNALRHSMTDYRAISWKERKHWKLRPEDTHEIHNWTKAVLEENLRLLNDKPTIVVTHHAPSRQSVHPRYVNDHYMNGGYCSDLENEFMHRHNIPLWIHGHTHDSFDYKVGRTRVVCNPRGYVLDWQLRAENPTFDAQKVIELP